MFVDTTSSLRTVDRMGRLALALTGVLVLVLLLGAGCSKLFGLEDPDPKHLDAPMQGSDVTGPDASDRCFGQWDPICFESRPTLTTPLPPLIDTRTTICDPHLDHLDYCVVARAGDLSIDQATRVVGDKPLVLIVTGTLTITAKLDVSSHRGDGTKGAHGVDPCVAAANGNRHDGGAGGSFQGRGGGGGIGGGGSNQTSDAGTPIAQPIVLRGGCVGAAGTGATINTLNGGAGGEGGGGVYLIGGTAIIVSTGAVDASGAGGGGAAASGEKLGGGGGGSGGMIVLDAPMLTIDGPVFADGGGGGGGANDTASANPGSESLGQTAATGGSGTGGGTGGGVGSHGTTLPGATVGLISQNDGGGGGGGGAGWILIPPNLAAALAAKTSPPAKPF